MISRLKDLLPQSPGSGLRTCIILAIIIYYLFFSAGRIELSSYAFQVSGAFYTLMVVMAISLLAFPDLSNKRYSILAALVIGLYLLVALAITTVIENPAAELIILIITLVVMRALSNALLSSEEDYQHLVTDLKGGKILDVAEGRERVDQEIARLKRFDRMISIAYCVPIDQAAAPLSHRLNDGKTVQQHIDRMFRQRRRQVQVAHALVSLVYKSDIVIQHEDALAVCLPDTTADEATRFIERVRFFLRSKGGADMRVGITTFSADGATFDQLLGAARVKVDSATEEDTTTNGSIRRGDVAVDLEQWLEIEANSKWLDSFAYQSPSAKAIYRPIKRFIDIVLSGIALLLLLPVFLVIALAVYLDDGAPVLFMQSRTGFGGKRFKMYKFRTMIRNAPAIAAQKVIGEDGQVRYVWPEKTENDPRITRVGRFLRKTSLDELPQILNVLQGDMSLIGPRPTTWDVSQYTLYQTERLTVQPGITGVWQVCARESRNPDERLLWDLKYVEKISLWLDLQIMLRTVLQVVKRKGN